MNWVCKILTLTQEYQLLSVHLVEKDKSRQIVEIRVANVRKTENNKQADHQGQELLENMSIMPKINVLITQSIQPLKIIFM